MWRPLCSTYPCTAPRCELSEAGDFSVGDTGENTGEHVSCGFKELFDQGGKAELAAMSRKKPISTMDLLNGRMNRFVHNNEILL